MMRLLVLCGIVAAVSAYAATSSSSYGQPVYTGRADFPTSLFESMYYVPLSLIHISEPTRPY